MLEEEVGDNDERERERERRRVRETSPRRLFVYASLGCHFSFQYFILSKMLWESQTQPPLLHGCIIAIQRRHRY